MKTNEMNIDIVAEIKRYLPDKHRLIMDIGVITGLRISDIISLKKEVLLIEKPTIHEQKTGKSRRIYIPKKLREKLIDYARGHSTNEFIFSSESKSGHVSRQAVFKAFKRASEKAGITDINIAPHSMRKSYACELFESGKELKYIQDKLNHSKEGDTIIYVRGSLDKLLKKQRRKRR